MSTKTPKSSGYFAKDIENARRIAYSIAKKNEGLVSIDQVRAKFEKKYGYWGNFAGAVLRGDNRFTPYFSVPSTSPSARGREILTWELVENNDYYPF